MWVLDTPAQRLERREEEKLRRKQAFRVLNKYKIESVDHNTSEPRDMLSPIRSRHSAVSALSNGRSSPMMSHGRQQHEAMMRPLLLPSDVPTSLPRETLVTLVLEKEPGEQGEDVERGQYDERIATGGLNVSDTNDNDGDAYLSDVERGIPHAALDHRPPPSSRTCVYSVTERPQTLLRRLSASASVFTAWALNYDPDVDY
ncbi:unnamed protein product [Hyaloperonospora brassicae]|nr:unnamed protein product [Hyaloperonospora brassicae]